MKNSLFCVLCGCVAALIISGCKPTWSSGGGSGSGQYSYLDEDGSYYRYVGHWLTGNDGRVYLLVVANGCTGSSSWSDASAADVRNIRGELHVRDGRKVPWSCESKDGRSGNVNIGGKDFDLARGAVFLVSTKDDHTHVEQAVIQDGQLQFCEDIKAVRDLAKIDERIATFLESCKDADE